LTLLRESLPVALSSMFNNGNVACRL